MNPMVRNMWKTSKLKIRILIKKMCMIQGSHSRVIDDSGFLGCDNMLLGLWFQAFFGNVRNHPLNPQHHST
jgi:hypothetical protein